MKIDLNKIYINYKVYSVIRLKNRYGFKVKLIYSDGTENIKQIGGYTKKSLANEARDNTIAQLKNHTFVIEQQIKFNEFSIYWLDNVMKEKIRYNSYMAYRNIINNYAIPFFKEISLNNINIGHIQKFYNMVTEKHKSVARLSKAVIKTLFDFAKEKSLIEVNPTEGISLPKSIEKINTKVLNINMEKTLSIEQVRLLIDKSKNTPIYLHILFAVLMGLRKQEINGLKYKDIDFVNRKLYLQRQLGVDTSKSKDKCKKKTYTKQEIPLKSYSSERILDIPDLVFEAILEERTKYMKNKNRRLNDKNNPFNDLGYICCSTYGNPRSKGFHTKYYKNLIKENNLPEIRFHDLRHTFATLLLVNNYNLKAISRMLGHANTIITSSVYFDKNKIIIDCEKELDVFINDIKLRESEKNNMSIIDINLSTSEYLI